MPNVDRLRAFLRTEAASGVLLLASAVVAFCWANLHPPSYERVFGYSLLASFGASAPHITARSVINDGLMAVFFFVVGMEIKRELVTGELNTLGKATLPAVAALGGMALPAGIFLAFNFGGEGQNGWGIPMATDIAFCVGILTILKSRVPNALIVFVTALAIFDDIGGILVIAFFYGHGLDPAWLAAAAVPVALLFALNRAFVTSGLAYAIAGGGLWYVLHRGGIHPTIAGVALGLMIPARPSSKSREAPGELLERFIKRLHPFVAFFVMPVFALANSGVSFAGTGLSNLFAPVALGTASGLFVGKQLGIFGFTLLAVKLGLAPMPGAASRATLYGVSVISGIGFTVALFIASLAYPEAPLLLDQAKAGILLGSLAAGGCGFAILRLTAPKAS